MLPLPLFVFLPIFSLNNLAHEQQTTMAKQTKSKQDPRSPSASSIRETDPPSAANRLNLTIPVAPPRSVGMSAQVQRDQAVIFPDSTGPLTTTLRRADAAQLGAAEALPAEVVLTLT
jgi:hypothetical protein